MKMTKPMMKACFSSLSTYDGTSVDIGTSSALAGCSRSATLVSSCSSSSPVCFSMNVRSGAMPSSHACVCDLVSLR